MQNAIERPLAQRGKDASSWDKFVRVCVCVCVCTIGRVVCNQRSNLAQVQMFVVRALNVVPSPLCMFAGNFIRARASRLIDHCVAVGVVAVVGAVGALKLLCVRVSIVRPSMRRARPYKARELIACNLKGWLFARRWSLVVSAGAPHYLTNSHSKRRVIMIIMPVDSRDDICVASSRARARVADLSARARAQRAHKLI